MKITIKGLDQATEVISSAVAVGIENGLAVIGARGEQLVKENITNPFDGRPPAVATGNLANSIQFKPFREVNMYRVVVFAAPPADVYADPVETGSRPHFPPPEALLLWVKKKFTGVDEKQALSIAFAVARKIAKRGVPTISDVCACDDDAGAGAGRDHGRRDRQGFGSRRRGKEISAISGGEP
jgi:hypothetical protein